MTVPSDDTELRIVVESLRLDGRAIRIVSIALTLHDLLSKKALDCVRNAPISVSDKVCDGAKNSISVEADLVDGCLFVLSSNKNDLGFLINSPGELDVLYTRLVL